MKKRPSGLGAPGQAREVLVGRGQATGHGRELDLDAVPEALLPIGWLGRDVGLQRGRRGPLLSQGGQTAAPGG